MIRTHLFYPLNYEAVNYPQTKYLCFSFWAGLWSRTTLYFGISTCYRYNKSALKLSKRTESNRPINFGRVAFYRWTTLAKKNEPNMGLEPTTYWLQVSCTTNRAHSAFDCVADQRSRTLCFWLMRPTCKPFHSSAMYYNFRKPFKHNCNKSSFL